MRCNVTVAAGEASMRQVRLSSNRGIAALSIAVAMLVGASSSAIAGPGVAAPPNDDFADAQSIARSALPYTYEAETSGATNEIDEPTPQCNDLKNSVWFKVKFATTTVVRSDTIGSDYNTGIAIWKGTQIDDLSAVDCSLAASTSEQGGRVTFPAKAGLRYYLQVGGDSSSEPYGGALKFHLRKVTPPANDAFKNATAISLPYTASPMNLNATRPPNEPYNPCARLGSSLWYRYTPGGSQTKTVQVSLEGSSIDTVVAVFSGTQLNDLDMASCDDDTMNEAGTTSIYQSVTTFKAVPGRQYDIAIGGYYGQTGQLQISAKTVTPPANDDWGNAQATGSLPASKSTSTRNATFQGPEPLSCLGRTQTVWYKFTPASNAALFAQASTAGTYPRVAVFSGNSLSGLSEVACQSGPEGVTFVPSSGTTYW
ncbi:MAG: hypothetical protein ABIZ34_07135, partial [Candidatus Limnocylindrales bacterium]